MRLRPGFERVLVPAVLTFAAGGLIGYMLGSRASREPAMPLDPDLAAYQAGVVAALELDPEQVEDVRAWLWKYQQERYKVVQAQSAGLEPSLAKLDQLFEQMLRTRILRPDQWARMEQLCKPQPLSAAATGG